MWLCHSEATNTLLWSLSRCKESPPKKQEANNSCTPLPLNTAWTKNPGANQVTITDFCKKHNLLHAELQILSLTTALQRQVHHYIMPVSQIRKAKAKANIFRNTGFWAADSLGMPIWRHWTTTLKTNACINPLISAKVWIVGQNHTAGQKHRLL